MVDLWRRTRGRIARRLVAGIVQFQSVASLYFVQPRQLLRRSSNLAPQDEFHVVEGGERRVGQKYARHGPAIPGGQVGQDQWTGTDLKSSVLAVDVNQVDGVFDRYAKTALLIAEGAKGVEYGASQRGLDDLFSGAQFDRMQVLLSD